MSCHNNTAVPGCFSDGVNPPASVVVHYTYDGAGQPAVRITDVAGAVVAAADLTNTSIGACVLPSPDTEFEMLCDVQPDNSSVKFVRRKIVTVDSLGVPTVAVADFGLDYVTPYTVTGTVGACPTCPDLPARGLQAAW